MHFFDKSMALDDIAWHFGNQHDEPALRETLNGLRELELYDAAACFEKMWDFMRPHMASLRSGNHSGKDFPHWLEEIGAQAFAEPMNKLIWEHCEAAGKSRLLASWARYARLYPERLCRIRGASMTTLQDQLDEITTNTRKLVQAERLAVGERAVAELFASGIEERILPVSAAAPAFALKDSSGRMVRSEDLLALGPLVVKFFRGRWCPYCMTELETWRDLYGKLREQGALMVAIGPQTERQSDFMVGHHGLPFPVLFDPATRSQSSLAWSTRCRNIIAPITNRSSSIFRL